MLANTFRSLEDRQLDGSAYMVGGIAIYNYKDCNLTGGIEGPNGELDYINVHHTGLPTRLIGSGFVYCMVAKDKKFLSELELHCEGFEEENCDLYFDNSQNISFIVSTMRVTKAGGSLGVSAMRRPHMPEDTKIIPGPFATFLSQDDIVGHVSTQSLKRAINSLNEKRE